MSASESAEVDALAIRRERNRISQRVARQKQANRIRELEQRIKSFNCPDGDRIAELEKENSSLRNQLLELHRVLEGVQSTLRTLSKAAYDASGADGQETVPSQCGDHTTSLTAPETWSSPVSQSTASRSTWYQSPNDHGNSSRKSAQSRAPASFGGLDVPVLPPKAFQPQLKFTPATELTSLTGQLVFGVNIPLGIESQSSLGNHLATIKHFLQPQFMTINEDYTSVSKLAIFMFSAFAACAWPALRTYFMYTRAHVNLAKVLLWRAFPSESTQASLQPRHSPTIMQLVEDYPLAIDIIPFPSVRDRLITHHANDPNLDRMICKIADAFVVETNLAQMVAGMPSTAAFIGVWDLARAMDREIALESGLRGCHSWASTVTTTMAESRASDMMDAWFPAASVNEIFEDRMKARAAFSYLRMNQGAVHWRLDPELFLKYPQLFDESCDPRACGVRIIPPHQQTIPVPRKMDLGAVSMYREFALLTIDALA